MLLASERPLVGARHDSNHLQLHSARRIRTRASAGGSQLRLLHPVKLEDSAERPLLVYLPGTDGTGQAILPQVDRLIAAGFDVKCLFIPPSDRSNWNQLTAQTQALVDAALAEHPHEQRAATVVGESFGGCLALQLAEAAPELVERLVLVNPATCFVSSLQGLSAFVSATNLLALFPERPYTTAQAVLLPLLVDINRVGPNGADAVRRMIFMQPTPDFDRYDVGPAAVGIQPKPVPTPGFVFPPAAAANFRTNLLREATIGNERLACITAPTLVLSAARDRMLPSITEGARLQRAMPNAHRVILPDSGHAALLETSIDLVKIMADNDFLPGACKQRMQSVRSSNGTQLSAVSAGSWGRPASVSGRSASSSTSSSISSSTTSSTASSRVASPVAGAASAAGAVAAPVLPVAATAAAAAGTGLSAAAEAASTSYNMNGNGSHANGNGVKPNADPSTTSSSGRSGNAASMPAPVTGFMPASSQSNGNGMPSSSKGRTRRSGSPASESSREAPQQQESAWDKWCQILAPWRDLVSPVVVGSELLPNPRSGRAMLFVGNHQLMGLYDMPLLFYELYMRGFEARGLAHPGHWSGPMGPFFEQFGAVKAGPMTAYKLLRSGEQVLLFPGGAREVHKRKGEGYKLFWPETPDFVRLASKCDAIIIPFAAVGADDAYDVWLDGEEVLGLPVLGDLLKDALQRVDPNVKPIDAVMPVTRLPGLGLPTPVPVPNLGRLYFKFCKPIDTRDINGERGSAEWQNLYNSIRHTVGDGMADLQALRARDSQRDVGPRLEAALRSWLPMVSNTVMSERPVPQVATAEAVEQQQEL